MDTNRLVLLVVICANILLGTFVYLKDRKNAVNVSFYVLTGAIALWTLSIFMIVSVWHSSNPIFWARITYAAGTFMAASFAAFSVIFPYGRMQTARKFILPLYSVAVAFAVVSLSPLSIKEIIFENGAIVKTNYGVGNILWALYVVICLGIAFYDLGRKWRRESGIKRLQIQYMFLGIVLTTVLIALTNIFIPLILGYEGAGAYGPCFTVIMMGCIAYAIVKHRLMDIRVFIKKGIIYSLLLAGAALGVGLLVVGIPYAFPDLSEDRHIIVSTLLGGSFMIFTLGPFSRNLKALIYALVFKEQYHYQRVLSRFNRLATRTLDLEELLKLIFNTTVETMKVDRASLWLLDPNTGAYHPALLIGLKPYDLRIGLSVGSGIVSYLEQSREPIVGEELERTLSLEDSEKFEDDFRKLRAEISLPLFAEDQMIGILNLGNKSSGRIYYEEDINLLKAIADQSSIAIQNAKLHQRVVNMMNYNEAVLENLTSGVIAIDLSYKITTANRAAAKILGFEAGEAIDSDKINELSVGAKYIQDLLVTTLKSDSGFKNLEVRISTMGGEEEKTILINTTILKDEKHQVTGAVAVFSDISSLKDIEEEVRQAEKFAFMGRLVAELAHEIKNPLVTIKTAFELLKEHPMENQGGLDREFLSLAMDEADRINELIRWLLERTRPASPKFAWCDVNQTLDETFMMLKNEMTDRNIELVDLRSVSLTEIFADRDQLKQVFLNIEMNALEAMEEGGKLTVETSMGRASEQLISRLGPAADSCDSVTVRFSDTGKGIPKDKLDKIFEPFYTTKSTGTGIGLAIVRKIVREHKGLVFVDSTEGLGTTFAIEFPLVVEKAEIVSEFDHRIAQDNFTGDKLSTKN